MKSLLSILLALFVILGNSQEKYRNFYTSVNTSNEKDGLALILANDDYSRTKNLASAVKDGKLMVEALKEVDFDIEIGFNLNRVETIEAINSFSSKLLKYKYAIIYYAGHGVQFGDKNFILPVDAGGSSEFQIKDSSIDIAEVLKALERIKIPKAVVLDACRENPFLNQLTSETMSVKGFGLAELGARENSIVIYSTGANTIVPDKNQFTEIFSSNIKNGGCIRDIIIKTRNEVLKTDANQLIFSREALLDNICFGDVAAPVELKTLIWA